MKLLTKDILADYGFTDNKNKTTGSVEIFTRDKMDIAVKDGLFYYSNMGIDYPLKDVAGLKKLYKELRKK